MAAAVAVARIIKHAQALRHMVLTISTGQDSHQRRGHRPRRLWQVDHHWSLDLPVRRYRQAYHREVREGRLVNINLYNRNTFCMPLHMLDFINPGRAPVPTASSHLGAHFHPSLWIFHFQCGCGVRLSASLSPTRKPCTHYITTYHHHYHLILLLQEILHHADLPSSQPLSSERVPSSTPGFLTSSRPSVSVVSPSTLPSGSSRLLSTMSPSLVCSMICAYSFRKWQALVEGLNLAGKLLYNIR